VRTKTSRSQLGWIEHKLGTGTASTRRLYAWSRRLRNRKELALRRSRISALDGSPDLVIPPERGYTLVPAGRIPEADEIAEVTRRVVDAALPTARRTTKKPQLLNGLLPKQERTLDSPFLRFALRRDVLRCVSDYLGAVPLLAAIDVWASIPSAELGNSQLYHCDWADVSQVKVFVHGSDVGRDNGPLVVMGATESESVRRRVGYRWRGRRYRISDEKMESLGADRHGEEVLGPAGTVALVDTCRCFHYGSRLSESGGVRALCVMSFYLPSAFASPSDPRKRAPYQHLATPAASEIERLVLGQIE
jgi:hypothetical protein